MNKDNDYELNVVLPPKETRKVNIRINYSGKAKPSPDIGESMIKNELEYKITKSQAEKFRRALEDLETAPLDEVHSEIRDMEAAALRSQLDDLRRDIEEYESLKARERKVTEQVGQMPWRLQIATALLAGNYASATLSMRLSPSMALSLADELIDKHELKKGVNRE